MALQSSPDSSSRHPLPLALTPILGREREIAALTALLTVDRARLVTVTGPGGVGKTRLALRVAPEVEGAFADGVVFVDLAPIRDPALVLPTIARVLGARQSGRQTALRQLTDFLEGRELLLILDNVEQVIDAAPDLAALLKAAPGLSILVTSREVLRLSAEHEFRLSPLPLPPARRRPTLAEVERNEAVALFAARARAANPRFALTEETVAIVAEIVRRLDGLPLAIELAAARSKVLSPAALLARLDHRFQVLTDGARDQPTRLQTMRSAIAWSYDLLTPEDQALFRCLGVFAGGFTLEAAETVCGPNGEAGADGHTPAFPSTVLDGVGSLVDKSLVRRLEERDDGDGRLGMLETVLAYSRERLAESGEETTIRRRHAEWACALAETAEPQLIGPEQDRWLDRLEAERDNLRAALDWACQSGEAELAQRLAGALWRFWGIRGYLTEGSTWTGRALALPGATPPQVRAKALHHLGNLALDLGEYDRAEAAYQAGLAIRRELGTPTEVATSLNGLGLVAFYRADYTRGRQLHEEALALRRRADDRQGIGNSLSNLGNIASAEGDYERACQLHEEALSVRRAMGDTGAVAYSLFNLGNIARLQDDLPAADRLFEESLALFREVGDKLGVGYALHELGRVAAQQGKADRAAVLLGESLALRRDLGDKRGVTECLEALAPVAAALGRPELAARLFGVVERLRQELSAPVPPAESGSHERAVGAVRRRLGAAAFDQAWVVGRSLSLADAIAAAIALAAEQPAQEPEPRPVAQASPASAERFGLTERELEVLRQVAAGRSDREIAEALFISPRTVGVHVSRILAKLNVPSRAAATALAMRHRLV